MEIFALGLILLAIAASPFVLLVLHLIARDRFKKLERSVRALSEGYEDRLQQLEARLAALERADRSGSVEGAQPAARDAAAAAASTRTDAASGQTPAPAAASETATEPSFAPTIAAGDITADASAGDVHVEAAMATTAAAAESPPAATTPPAAAPKAEPGRRTARSSADWEELIGGNLLNKIGAVVTVIGIALALGYSMRYLGPTGRVTLALAVSGAMLGIGGLLEGRERYRVFARGLIGGGWAGLYFTTFAMHGLDAARIIDSAAVGTTLLIVVAAGMVLHSLVYRSETVTGLAYLVTFATLAIVPTSRFALLASLPAAASLLYVSWRFRWQRMMVAGVVFTYGAYLLRGGAPDVGPEDWVFGQVLLVVYWFLFEIFDLTALRGRSPGGIDETLMPLNAAGFIGASLLGWSAVRPDSLWAFFVLSASLLSGSAALRGMILADSTGSDEKRTERPRADGYQVALALAALMLVFGIERGFDGWRQNVAWLLQAQLLVLSGLMVRNRFLRQLGSAVLLVPVLAVAFDDLPSSTRFIALGRSWLRSTPLALLTAGVLYADRALVRRAAGVRVIGLEHLYNWMGTFFVAAVLASELPEVWVAPAWFTLALVLIGFSLSRGASELFLQGYALGAFSWLLMLLGNVPTRDLVMDMPARWSTALPMIAVLYGLAYMRRTAVGGIMLDGTVAAAADDAGSSRADGDHGGDKPGGINAVADTLDRTAASVMFGAATLMSWWFLLFEVSGRWLTVAWGLQGAALLVVGFVLGVRAVRLTGLGLLGVCIGKLFVYDVAELETVFRILSFIVLGALLLAVSFAYSRYREQIRRLL